MWWQSAEEIIRLAGLDLKRGDWISNVMDYIVNPGYRHHSIYVGNDMVVGRGQSGVVKQSISGLDRIDTVRLERRGGEEEAKRAESMVVIQDTPSYSITANNSVRSVMTIISGSAK